MIIYLLLSGFDLIVNFVIALIPTFQTPIWFAENIGSIIEQIVGFNYYLPVVETVGVVLFLVGFTFNYKVLKIVLEKAGVNLNA